VHFDAGGEHRVQNRTEHIGFEIKSYSAAEAILSHGCTHCNIFLVLCGVSHRMSPISYLQ
jgi:hypothetical protein